MTDLSDALFLFNPLSNEGRSSASWKKARSLRDYLPEKPIDITKIDNLVEFIRERNPSVVVACGGDGTINSVCTAVYKLGSKIPVAVFPLGFGNALAYCLGVETIEKALYVLENQDRIENCDLFSTNIPEFPIAVFTVGIGFDAKIVHARMNDRYIGFRSYVLSAIKSIFMHGTSKLSVKIDECVSLEAVASALVVTNAPIIGQNYVINENARLNDHILDCILFSTKYAYITNLRFKGFKHPLYNELNKVRFSAQKILVNGETYVQVDGDPIIYSKDVEIKVIPKAIKFVCNQKSEIITSVTPFYD